MDAEVMVVPTISEEKECDWLDPTPEMLESEDFKAIWELIKTWDINAPEAYKGYCQATGNHVRAILGVLSALVTDERSEMQHLYDLAMTRAEEVVNPVWKRAYLRLADIADTIDAMIARTIDREDV